jgi:diacylglycerol kinase family enzyme
MQNISVYLNQKASNGSEDWKAQINHALFRSTIEYQTPTDLNELYKQLETDVKNNVDAVLSIGGDGTMNTLIQRLAGTNIGLLVVPCGTANDFAKVLGSSKNIKKITQIIRQDCKQKIDLININGQFMATNGGLGLAAEVALEINDLRKKYPKFKNVMKFSGKSIYSLFLVRKLLSRTIKSYEFKISSSEFSGQVSTALILINNQPSLAGNFVVAPNTNHRDGKMNITIFKHQNRIDLIGCISKIFAGAYPVDDKDLISFETSEIFIELMNDKNEKLSFFGDGENFKAASSWNIRCHPDFLTVYSDHDKDLGEIANICPQVSLV